MSLSLPKYGLIICILFLYSCTEFIAKPDLQNEWERAQSGNIILHYRKPGFSENPSPSPQEVQFILNNQKLYYKAIQDSIHKNYSDNVLIYLHNQGEAIVHTGSDFGGHSIPKFNAFYFSFFHQDRSYTDKYGVENPFLGAHELVHVITHQTLGYPGTKLMSEGYANWLDGSYANYSIINIVRSYRDNQPEKIMTPGELLFNTESADEVYYPNVGVFTAYLVSQYGVERVNRLFPSVNENFKINFERVTGKLWSDMKEDYLNYIDNL